MTAQLTNFTGCQTLGAQRKNDLKTLEGALLAHLWTC
jgi:hypothetical protein